MIGVLIITHGRFGSELLRTAEDIVGRQSQAAAIDVTSEMGPEGLGQAIELALQSLSGPEGILILVDMLGGTPCNASLLKTKDLKAHVLTGVNLYMALSVFRHRASLDLDALASKSAEDGRRSITLAADLLKKRLS